MLHHSADKFRLLFTFTAWANRPGLWSCISDPCKSVWQ